MRFEIKIPSAGESVSEVRIGRWLQPDKQFVERDTPIVELETDKANMELTAEESGILERVVPEGKVTRVGDVVGYINTEATTGKLEDQIQTRAAQGTKVRSPLELGQSHIPRPEAPASQGQINKLTPAIRKLARERGLNLEALGKTGSKERLRKDDVIKYSKSQDPRPTPDIEPKSARPRVARPIPVTEEPAGAPVDREKIVPMSLLRKTIADRMVKAQQTAAILTTFNEVDMTAVQALRTRYKESFMQKYGIGLGLMSFFVKASIEALRLIPELNAMIEGENIIYKNYYNIGVAVSTNRGLVVPVLREADKMDFSQIESSLADYAGKAREGKISVEDLKGGTFTITNGGVFGSLLSTPILNPPESGILGMHAIKKRPIVVNDEVVVRPMMYLALSYDHRIVDGKEAVTFLVKIKECLEDPQRLLLGI